MQHGQTPKNRCLPFAKCLNAWPWCLRFIWLKRWLPFFGLSWHMTPKSSMMTGRCICYAPTTGYNPSIRNCYIHRPVTMRQGQEKGIDPAVAWPVSLHTLGHPRNGNHLLLAPDFVTGLVVFAMRILCRCGFRPTGPLWYYTSCNTRRIPIEPANPSWMDQEEAPVDIKKQWQEARANRRMQFKVGNYRDGDKESNICMLTGTIKTDWIQLPVERYLAAPSYIETRCHCWGVQEQRSRTLGHHEGWEVAAFGLSSQWPVIGWLVCRSLRPAHCVAWRVHVGSHQFAQGGRLWLSPPTEEVWRPKHVGQHSPTMATFTAASWNQRAWLVIRSLREKSGFSLTGLIGLATIWKMNFVLMVIL